MEYLSPYVPELKYKDYQVYEAYRAGISTHLRKSYGIFAQLWCRNKNLVAFAILSDGLAGRLATVNRVRDFKNPMHYHTEMSQTKGIIFAAQISVFLCWYRLQEQIVRSNTTVQWIKSKIKQMLLRPAYQKVGKELPIINRLFLQEWDYAQALRTTKCSDFKEGSKPMVQIFGALMASCANDDDDMRSLQRIGQQLGYMIYLLSSAERHRADEEKGRYNVYTEKDFNNTSALENAQRQSYQAAAELRRSYHTLMFPLHRSLVENIFVDGVEHMIMRAGGENEESL